MQERKKIDTLKNSYEFEIVFKNGLRFNKDFMTIHAIPLHEFISYLHKKRRYYRAIESKLLLGFSINKKVAKACDRNLLRRRIKATMRELFSIFKGYVFVFICRKNIMELDSITLKKHVIYSAKKLMRSNNTNH